MYIITSKRPQINNVNGRIRDIEDISYYDYETKPKPLNRFLNIWLVLTFISVILFIDALLLIGKNHELQKLKNFTVSFPLTKKNVEEYIQKWRTLICLEC